MSPLKGSHSVLTCTSVGLYVRSNCQLDTWIAPAISTGSANVVGEITIRLPSEIVVASACDTPRPTSVTTVRTYVSARGTDWAMAYAPFREEAVTKRQRFR